jgi:hypothetical protein
MADLDPDREDFLMLLAGVTPRQMADLAEVHVNSVTSKLRPYVQAVPGLMELHKSRIPVRAGVNNRSREQWQARHDELMAFHADHGQLPTNASDHPGEKSLARWLYNQRKAKREGQLDEGQLRLMDQVPGWFEGRMRRAHQARHLENLDKLEAFYMEHDRWPRFQADDPMERAVGVWLLHRRAGARNGTLDEALATELNARCPGWRGHVYRPRNKPLDRPQ